MTTVSSVQPWQLRELNQSGIRRLKLVDATSLLYVPGVGLVPQKSFEFFEFIFPADLSCQASFERKVTESLSGYWSQLVSYSLPHLSDELAQWVGAKEKTQWCVLTEDYNGVPRMFGGMFEGLNLAFQGNTGSGPKDVNPLTFSFSGDQLAPYIYLASYEDSVLFPAGGFSYGFSIGFNS